MSWCEYELNHRQKYLTGWHQISNPSSCPFCFVSLLYTGLQTSLCSSAFEFWLGCKKVHESKKISIFFFWQNGSLSLEIPSLSNIASQEAIIGVKVALLDSATAHYFSFFICLHALKMEFNDWLCTDLCQHLECRDQTTQLSGVPRILILTNQLSSPWYHHSGFL